MTTISPSSTSPASGAVRTRFAPSPTGFIHMGNIRSALYPWAFARSRQGTFILRIEDTDQDRSTQAAVDVILEGMQWLDMQPDEGPYFQMQRMARYREVLAQLQASGQVYPCYMSVEALDALRARQLEAKEKPRYDGTWRPEPGKVLPAVPQGVQPVLRFKTPQSGTVSWNDEVKGRIEVENAELDDLVIARPDGTPTYNFCVVVDDIDMQITHVIRGDDHVNNTPRQIHIFRALGHEVPVYAHLPTVLDASGNKLSKRNGAKAVTQYRDEGFLPDAVVNYLARLGWSHGDEEIFSREQFLQWFDLAHLGKSAARFDEAKLRWVNAQHLKALGNAELAEKVTPFLQRKGIALGERLEPLCGLLKDRCDTLVDLSDWLARFDEKQAPDSAASPLPPEERAVSTAIADLAERLTDITWNAEAISVALKQTLQTHGLKMPQLAMPVRLRVLGVAQTPSLDGVLSLLSREFVLARLQRK